MMFWFVTPVMASPIDKYAEPVPILSSGSFVCETWIDTTLDSFNVGGAGVNLTGADWSFSQGFVQYNLTGTFMQGFTISLDISGTMGAMGYKMEHTGNDLYMYMKCYDVHGNELEDLTQVIQIDDSMSATLSDTVSVQVPNYVKEVELYGAFTCSWTTPASRASEMVGVKVVLESESEPVEQVASPVITPSEPVPELEYDPDWFSPENYDENSIVRFGDLHGEVLVKRYGEDDDAYVFASLDTPLHHGDVIKTLPRSGAILSFSDMSSFVMKEDTIIVLDIKNERESKIGLVAGNIWINLKKMVEDGSMEVEMSQAVAGIKGTTFICEEKGGVSTLKVFEGTVELTPKNGDAMVKVNGGEMIVASYEGLGKLAKLDVESELQTLDKNTRKITEERMAESKSGLGIGSIILIMTALVLTVGVAIFILKKKR